MLGVELKSRGYQYASVSTSSRCQRVAKALGVRTALAAGCRCTSTTANLHHLPCFGTVPGFGSYVVPAVVCTRRMSLALYRQIVREASKLPAKPVKRKILYNTREAYSLYATETDQSRLFSLHQDAAAAARVIAWLNSLPQVLPHTVTAHQRGPKLLQLLIQASARSKARTPIR